MCRSFLIFIYALIGLLPASSFASNFDRITKANSSGFINSQELNKEFEELSGPCGAQADPKSADFLVLLQLNLEAETIWSKLREENSPPIQNSRWVDSNAIESYKNRKRKSEVSKKIHELRMNLISFLKTSFIIDLVEKNPLEYSKLIVPPFHPLLTQLLVEIFASQEIFPWLDIPVNSGEDFKELAKRAPLAKPALQLMALRKGRCDSFGLWPYAGFANIELLSYAKFHIKAINPGELGWILSALTIDSQSCGEINGMMSSDRPDPLQVVKDLRKLGRD